MLDFGLNHLDWMNKIQRQMMELVFGVQFHEVLLLSKDWAICLTQLYSFYITVSFWYLSHQSTVQEDDCASSLPSLGGVLVDPWEVSLLMVFLFKITFHSLTT